jgi:hypothetical protein
MAKLVYTCLRRWHTWALAAGLALILAGCGTQQAGTFKAPQLPGGCQSVLVSVTDMTNGKVPSWLVTLRDTHHGHTVVLDSGANVTAAVTPGQYTVVATGTSGATINVTPKTIDAVCGGFYVPGSGTPCAGTGANCRLGIEIQLSPA